MAIVTGTSGDDILVQNAGEDDQLDGLGGSDTLDLSAMTEAARLFLALSTGQVIGPSQGTDTIVNIENAIGTAFDDLIVGVNGGSVLYGGDGQDQLQGRSGDDDLNGYIGDDLLIGNAGNDVLFGSSGNDVLRGGLGNNTLDGSSGFDRADYSVMPEGVSVSLASGTADPVSGNGSFHDDLTSIEEINASPYDDVIIGNDSVNKLFGLAGDDYIDAGLGNDTLSGGAGDDIVIGGGGRDYVLGGHGNDTLITGLGRTTAVGEEGIDTVDYSSFNRPDGMFINLESRRAFFQDGSGDINDRLYEFENVIGTDGDDKLIGNAAANQLLAGVGNDYIDGKEGDDDLQGGDGDDTIIGRTGSDLIDGGAGNDYLRGDEGDDTLTGGEGENNFVGADGNDRLITNATDGSQQLMNGGTGNDVFEIHEAHQIVTIDDFTPGDDLVRLELVHTNINSFAQLVSNHLVAPDTLLINNMYIAFNGIDIANDLSDADFLFHFNLGPNTDPIAVDDAKTLHEDSGAFALSLIDNDSDPDFDPITITAFDDTGTVGLVNLTSGHIGYDPNGQFEHLRLGETVTDTFTYTISDGRGGTDTATVTITIDGRNDAPTLSGPTSASMAENQTLVPISFTAADADAGDTPLFEISGGVDQALFQIDPVTGQLSFITAPDFEAPTDSNINNLYHVSVRARDGQGIASDALALSITVTDEPGALLLGSGEDDTIIGTPEDDNLQGRNGDDIIYGRGDDDLILGGEGFDTLYGEDGDDFLRPGTKDGQTDTVDGGAGADTLDYRFYRSSTNWGTGLRVEFSGVNGSGTTRDLGLDKYHLTNFSNIEILSGSPTGDVLENQTAEGHTLYGNGGDDVLIGGAGADTLNGGAGDDEIHVSHDGFASANGGDDTDTLVLDGTGFTLDLTALPNTAVTGIEYFDLGSNGNTLALDAAEVAGLGGLVYVQGDASDTLSFVDSGWVQSGAIEVDGLQYDIYQSGASELRVQWGVGIETPPAAISYDHLEWNTDGTVGGLAVFQTSSEEEHGYNILDFDPRFNSATSGTATPDGSRLEIPLGINLIEFADGDFGYVPVPFYPIVEIHTPNISPIPEVQIFATAVPTQSLSYSGMATDMSDDGMVIAFERDGYVWMRDEQAGTESVVSKSDGGVLGMASGGSISADGRYVAFVSDADNLVAGDSNGVADIFIYDRMAGTTVRVSTDDNGSQLIDASLRPTLTSDGTKVGFESGGAFYLKDLATGDLQLISNHSGVEMSKQANFFAYIDIFRGTKNFYDNEGNWEGSAPYTEARIFSVDPVTGQETELVFDAADPPNDQFYYILNFSDLVIAPDGSRFAYDSYFNFDNGLDRTEDYILYEFDVASQAMTALSSANVDNYGGEDLITQSFIAYGANGARVFRPFEVDLSFNYITRDNIFYGNSSFLIDADGTDLVVNGNGQFTHRGDMIQELYQGNSGISNLMKAQIFAAHMIGGSREDLLIGSEYGDLLEGHEGSDVLIGKGGNDRFQPGLNDGETDTIKGGDGSDRIEALGYVSSIAPIQGLDVDITAIGAGTIYSTATNSILLANFEGIEAIFATDANDNFTNTSTGPMSMFGLGGMDTLTGGSGVELLNGGDGIDTLDSGAGNDRLFGGAGADLFILNDGVDRLLDFVVGEDVLNVAHAGYTDFASVQANLLDAAGGAILSHAGGSTQFLGVTVAQLDQFDFSYVP